MELVRKRLRKNENSNGRSESSDTDLLNEDQELVQTIPTLVSEIFLEELRDVRLLKTCRLVCKSWNMVASKSLRVCSVVSLKENSGALKDFAALLRKQERHSLQHFPSPFQNFHVEGIFFTEPTFINLVFTPSITCTSLRVHLYGNDDKDLDQSQLSLFLAANKDSIADLEITAYNNLGFELNGALVNDAVRLTSLKSLKFTDYCQQCPHIQFLQNVMRMCRPTCLDLNFGGCESLQSLLLDDQVTHIQDLHLFCGSFSGNVLTYLANTGFQLRTLSLFGFVNDEYLEELYSVLENVSPSLMDFRTDVPIGTKLQFPKLKEIHIRNYKKFLSVFTPENFPSLTKIIFNVEESILPSWENCVIPHKGVKYCVIHASDISWPFERSNEIKHELFVFLTFVNRQFPNVTSLDFSIPRFQSSTLTDICKAFPSLKALKLDGQCDFFSFAGFGTSSLNRGLPVEMIPRRGSISDFKKLEVIKFGSKFCVSADMIRHCLPRIPKLKQIELYWDRSLSAPLFRDFVAHLDKIVILGPHYFAAEMVQVQQLLPNSVVML